MTNFGNPEHPWIIEAKVNSSSNSNVSLLFETQIQVTNGYANFSRLGVSDIVDRLVISYNFKLPLGLNE